MDPDTNAALVLLPQAKLFPLDYAAPEGMLLEKGQMVIVPYRNQRKVGVVIEVGIKSKAKNLRKIEALLSDVKISNSMIEFLQKSSSYYLEEMGSMAKLMLPVDLTDGKNEAFCQQLDNINLPELSEAQSHALMQLVDNPVSVLYGITGSGKTEVYFHLIKRVIDSGKQALLMLPEIALSKQIVQRFEERFGEKAVIWNSSITGGKKHKYFFGIMKGSVKVVIGTRSALFLPYKNLGLIIVDEEHDNSYKQDDQILYNARDMSVLRGHIEKIPVVLGSATPSLETFYNVKQGRYKEVILTSRFGDAGLPDVSVIDMRKKKKKNIWISDELKEAIARKIDIGEQVMLFLNRKGYAPLLLCNICGHRATCNSCSSALVYHKAASKLTCHHCGFNIAAYQNCSECHSEDSMIPCGPGVERIYEEVKNLFPDANIQVMTREEMNGQKKSKDVITNIMNGKTDIIIGTQIITKGYHFPRLTFVGVIDTDVGLSGGDLRASEKTFQLLNQVGGRAGRESIKGLISLQTYNPESEFIKLLKEHDFNGFMQAELEGRVNAQMPPVTRMAALIMSGRNEVDVKRSMQKIVRLLPLSTRVTILGPVAAILSKLQNNYRYRVMLIADKKFNMQGYIAAMTNQLERKIKDNLKIDIDPYNFY